MWTRALIALLFLLIGSPGCATFLVYDRIHSTALGQTKLVREVSPDLVVREVGEPPRFYCVQATYPDGTRIAYDVTPDDYWHVQSAGATTRVRAHDPDHPRGQELDPEHDLDFAHGIVDVRGRLGRVSLSLPNCDEYRTTAAPPSARAGRLALHLLYPLAFALDAATWPLQLVAIASMDPTTLP